MNEENQKRRRGGERVVTGMYKASCWDCNDVYIGKTKRRLHDRKTEHFEALTKSCQVSVVADHITSTGHSIKWDHFVILATGRSGIEGNLRC